MGEPNVEQKKSGKSPSKWFPIFSKPVMFKTPNKKHKRRATSSPILDITPETKKDKKIEQMAAISSMAEMTPELDNKSIEQDIQGINKRMGFISDSLALMVTKIDLELMTNSIIEKLEGKVDRLNEKIVSVENENLKLRKEVSTKAEVQQIKRDISKTTDDKIAVINTRLMAVEKENAALKKDISSLRTNQGTATGTCRCTTQVLENKARLDVVQNSVNDVAQYTRRGNLRFYNVRELPREDTKVLMCNIVRDTIGLHLKKSDLGAAHRLPIPNNVTRSIRSVIVRFNDREHRELIHKNAKKFKDQWNISVTEDLTPQNSELLRKARQCVDLVDPWSRNGTVLAKKKDETRVTLNLFSDFKSFEVPVTAIAEGGAQTRTTAETNATTNAQAGRPGARE